MARRRWQEGTVYFRKSKTLPDAWWGRYVETVQAEDGTVTRVHRNVFLGRAGDKDGLTKPLAKRALREKMDEVNNFRPTAIKPQIMGKATTPFPVFATRWQKEVLIHKRASTVSSARSHIKNFLIPAFGRLAMGDFDSERVQSFLNRLCGISPKTVKNVWTTLHMMWNSAVAWKYVTGELVVTLPQSRKFSMRCYTIEEVKRILANTEGADRMFFWLAAETGLRAGELTALRVSDIDLANLSLEVNKSIWHGSEGQPKTSAGFRTVPISSRLGAHLMDYVAGRTTGYLFQTGKSNPWDSSDVLNRKLNPVLARLEIPKIDPKLLSRIVGKDRTIDQATRSEKRAASLGLHSFRHTSTTAMDSLGIPHQVRKQRLGHSNGSVTENYTHTFTRDERDAAEKIGDLFGTNWPEVGDRKAISFPNLSQIQEGLPNRSQEALIHQ